MKKKIFRQICFKPGKFLNNLILFMMLIYKQTCNSLTPAGKFDLSMQDMLSRPRKPPPYR